MCDSRRAISAIGKKEIVINSRTAYITARNAVTGPWVAVNGPAASGNRATSKIPNVVKTAAFWLDRSISNTGLGTTLFKTTPVLDQSCGIIHCFAARALSTIFLQLSVHRICISIFTCLSWSRLTSRTPFWRPNELARHPTSLQSEN
jgi:hypothetical protein